MRATACRLAALACLSWAGLAAAAPCYVVYDRNDAIIYRDYVPPFDLSDSNAPERKIMRQQGQHLIVAEFDNCNPVGFISPVTGATAATVDEIVNQVQPAISTSIAKSGGVVQPGTRPGGSPGRGGPGGASGGGGGVSVSPSSRGMGIY